MNNTLSSRPWLAPLLVFVIALAGMSRICTNDFVDWDDSFTLYANAKMNPPTGESLRFYWTNAEHGLYMPATQTMWAGLAAFAQSAEPNERGIRLNARVFHTASVVLHALAAVIAFLLLRRLLTHSVANTGETPAQQFAAAMGAMLFALHPVQVESVAWAAGTKDVLCGLFALIALWQYVAAVQSSSRTRFVVATIAFAVALLCKPAAVVVPALAMVIHVVMLRGSWKDAAKRTVIWWPMALAIMIVARLAQPVTVPGPALWMRPLVALDALAFYIGKILWPAKLCIDYGRTPTAAQHSGWLYATWLVPVAIAALLIRKPRREAVAAGLIAAICVAPMLGLTPFMFQYYSTVSDHYLYLAMIGPALLLAWIVMNGKPLVRPIAAIAIGLLAMKSLAQQSTWRDDQSLFSHTLAANPRSFMAANNLASAYQVTGKILISNAPLAEQMGDRATAQACRAQARENYAKAAELYVLAIEKRKAFTGGVDDYANAHTGLDQILAKLKQSDSTRRASASAN